MAERKTKHVFMIDCQLLQTKAWHRGMGKYTARVLEAWTQSDVLMKHTPSLILLFNSKLPYTDELKSFVSGLGRARAEFLELDIPNYEQLSTITEGQRRNTKKIDEYINENYKDQQISFMITSLFLDEACPAFPTTAHKSLIYYDLIPLLYVKKYLGFGTSEQFFTRFSVLYEADTIFSISETVANDLTNFLGFPAEKIVNILGASNQSMHTQRGAAKPLLPIDRPFVLMPTGGDPRKNNELGVRAFSKFNSEHGNKYQLVITSYFNDDQKKDLHELSADILFTDNVTDDELWWLYINSAGILFPSEYEGLGMPVLEAMEAGKLIACSDIAVFREISEDAYFTFSPYSIDETVLAIDNMINVDPATRKEKIEHYKIIQSLYTWHNTAKIIHQHMSQGGVAFKSHRESRPSIAIIAPHVCGTSELGLWATNQYPVLSTKYRVDYFYEVSNNDFVVRPSYLTFVTKVYNIFEFTKERYKNYDLVVYVYDGSKRSRFSALAALSAPGLFICGKNDIDSAHKSLIASGYIADTHQAGNMQDEIVRRSLKFIDTSHTHDMYSSALADSMSKPPYGHQPGSSLTNRITLIMTGASNDIENAKYIRELTDTLDTSQAEVTVLCRAMIHPNAREIVDSCPIKINEKMTDHEYMSALMRTDMYVDCSVDESFESALRLATTRNLSIPALVRGKNESIAIMLDRTYKWLISGQTGENRIAARKKATLLSVIDELVAAKGSAKKRDTE